MTVTISIILISQGQSHLKKTQGQGQVPAIIPWQPLGKTLLKVKLLVGYM